LARLAWISFLGCVVVILQTSPFETEARRREEGGGRREERREGRRGGKGSGKGGGRREDGGRRREEGEGRREEGGGRRECQRDYVRECADASTCRHRLDARRAYKACV